MDRLFSWNTLLTTENGVSVITWGKIRRGSNICNLASAIPNLNAFEHSTCLCLYSLFPHQYSLLHLWRYTSSKAARTSWLLSTCFKFTSWIPAYERNERKEHTWQSIRAYKSFILLSITFCFMTVKEWNTELWSLGLLSLHFTESKKLLYAADEAIPPCSPLYFEFHFA